MATQVRILPAAQKSKTIHRYDGSFCFLREGIEQVEGVGEPRLVPRVGK